MSRLYHPASLTDEQIPTQESLCCLPTNNLPS